LTVVCHGGSTYLEELDPLLADVDAIVESKALAIGPRGFDLV
jgi:hypothetical protein